MPELIPSTRPDTLLNELRALLVNYTPAERVIMFKMIGEDYCVWCGYSHKEGCVCERTISTHPPPTTPEARSGVIDANADASETHDEWRKSVARLNREPKP